MRIYHIVPKRMCGDSLLPLKELKDIQPDIYALEIQKYEHRTALLNIPIPPLGLDCYWKNVVFFTPIPPKEMRLGWEAGGVEVPRPLAFFEVETDSLNQSKLAIYPNAGVGVEKIFFPFTKRRATMYRRVRNSAVEHFQSERAAGRSPKWFSMVPHILYRGPVKVDFNSVVRA